MSASHSPTCGSRKPNESRGPGWLRALVIVFLPLGAAQAAEPESASALLMSTLSADSVYDVKRTPYTVTPIQRQAQRLAVGAGFSFSSGGMNLRWNTSETAFVAGSMSVIATEDIFGTGFAADYMLRTDEFASNSSVVVSAYYGPSMTLGGARYVGVLFGVGAGVGLQFDLQRSTGDPLPISFSVEYKPMLHLAPEPYLALWEGFGLYAHYWF